MDENLISIEDILTSKVVNEENLQLALKKAIPNSYALERIASSSKDVVIEGQDILVKIPGISEPYRDIERAELSWYSPISLDMQLTGKYGEEAVKNKNIVRFDRGIITAKAYRITEKEIKKRVHEIELARLDPNVKLYLRNGKELELPQVNGTPVFYVVNGSIKYKEDKRDLSFLF